jgi:hypothetical protein
VLYTLSAPVPRVDSPSRPAPLPCFFPCTPQVAPSVGRQPCVPAWLEHVYCLALSLVEQLAAPSQYALISCAISHPVPYCSLPSASVPHVIAAPAKECTTLHRTNVQGQVKAKTNPPCCLTVVTFFSTLALFPCHLLFCFVSSNIPCTSTISYGVPHHCSSSICTTGRPQSDRRPWRATSSHTVISKLVAAGSTSTVDHGAFSTGPSKCRAAATRIPAAVPYRSHAQ